MLNINILIEAFFEKGFARNCVLCVNTKEAKVKRRRQSNFYTFD